MQVAANSTTVATTTTAPLANTPAKATVRTRRAANALAKAKGATLAAPASKPVAKRNSTGGSKAPSYNVVPLAMAGALAPSKVAGALAALRAGHKPSRAAGTLGLTVGQYAMACMVGGTTPLGQPVPNHAYSSGKPGAPGTPAALAKYVAGARRAGRSWGWLAAATRTTEGTVRAAYQAGTGQHHSTTGVGAWAHRNAR